MFDLILDTLGALCVFVLPIGFLFIAYGFS